MIGRSDEVRAKLSEESSIRAAEQMVAVLGSMKGVAMKLGQMMSIIDMELVPPSHRDTFQQKLAVLRNSAPTTSLAAMRAVIEEDHGQPIEKLFAEFEPEAIAAASIGQVYRAKLHDGRTVAVKVQYPGIEAAVRADLKNLNMLSPIWKVFLPWVSQALLDELATNLEHELDYRAEALTQERVAREFADHPFLRVPASVPELCSERVLVTEHVDGIGFEEIRELPQDERNRIGEIIYRFYVGSMFRTNEFCGDPHPGNVLLGKDGRVSFLDFGLYNQMDPEHVELEAACLRAAAEDRGADLVKLMAKGGIIRKSAGVTAEDCLDYVYSASGWCLVDQVLAITPDVASGAFLLAVDPRASEFGSMKLQNLPPEHLFSRRADFLTFGILGQLGASANWHTIAREWLYDDPPATALGVLDKEWRESRA